jgi:hypothetical protein
MSCDLTLLIWGFEMPVLAFEEARYMDDWPMIKDLTIRADCFARLSAFGTFARRLKNAADALASFLCSWTVESAGLTSSRLDRKAKEWKEKPLVCERLAQWGSWEMVEDFSAAPSEGLIGDDSDASADEEKRDDGAGEGSSASAGGGLKTLPLFGSWVSFGLDSGSVSVIGDP